MRQNQNITHGSLSLTSKVKKNPETGNYFAETTINGQTIKGPETPKQNNAAMLLRQIVEHEALNGTINFG